MRALRNRSTMGSTGLLATVAAVVLALLMPLGSPVHAVVPGDDGRSTRIPAAPTRITAELPELVKLRVAEGPSPWLGRELRHPNGRRFPEQVLQWGNLVRTVMRDHRVRPRFLRGILAQIQQESSGRPSAINLWDSNARRGTPSKGLLQVILPTYRAYAHPELGHKSFQTVPYANIWAALNYVKDRYGKKKFRKWNRGHNQGY